MREEGGGGRRREIEGHEDLSYQVSTMKYGEARRPGVLLAL